VEVTAALLEASARAPGDATPLLRILCLHPANLATWRQLAGHHARAGTFEDGFRAYRVVSYLGPRDPTVHVDRSTFERLAGDRTAAERAMRRALSIEPVNPAGWLVLGEFAQLMGSRGCAERLVRCAECLSENSDSGLSIVYARLRNDPRNRWLRKRFRIRHAGAFQAPWVLDRAPGREWLGPRHRVSSLLVWGEMGVGDQVFFARDLDRLSRIIDQVWVVVHPRLRRLFQRSFPGVEILPGPPSPTVRADIDAEISIGDLGAVLPFESVGPYLKPDPSTIPSPWFTRGRGKVIRVGISWRGGGRLNEAPLRQLSRQDLSRILESGSALNIEWVSLQHGVRDDERGEVARLHGVEFIDSLDLMGDADPLAACLSSLDMLVSVNNTNVHFAGALGLPTAVLLRDIPTWLWGASDDQSPWYRGTVLYREHDPRTNVPMVDRLLRDFESYVRRAQSSRGPNEI